MSSAKKPVEHLQAKPYNPRDKRGAARRHPQRSATAFFVRQRAGGKKNPFKNSLLGYLLLFFITALLATALIFGFIVLLVLVAVLLPVWLVARFARSKGAS